MVIWVFAGGGESEMVGLLDFLRNNYQHHNFQRKSPIRLKPGPKPRAQQGYGGTGKSLAKQISMIIRDAISYGEQCDFILVIDDLDCHQPPERRQLLVQAIDQQPTMVSMPRYVGFASPEIEAWIIADWDQTVARDIDFRHCHQAMRYWMSTKEHVPFDYPEEFSEFSVEKDACSDKLSEILINAALTCSARRPYSKAIHTPRFLRTLSSITVSQKCPLFREMHNQLAELE